MMSLQLIKNITSDDTFQKACDWLLQKRKKYHHNSDVWDFLIKWDKIVPAIRKKINDGNYQFDIQKRVRINGESIDVWTAMDSVILKSITLVLSLFLKPYFSKNCCHIKGNGGTRKAIKDLRSNINQYRFFCRSDVKSYYASIDHNILLSQAEKYIPDMTVIRLIWLYLKRTIDIGGKCIRVHKGIGRGCSLSPLMGALYLKPLDDRMEALDVFYTRFMDDWVILAKKRWQLRNAIKIMNETLNELRLKTHPDKTSMGKIEKGFNFLGYHISSSGISIAQKSFGKFKETIDRLYEQGADAIRIGQYINRWQGYYGKAVKGVTLS